MDYIDSKFPKFVVHVHSVLTQEAIKEAVDDVQMKKGDHNVKVLLNIPKFDFSELWK